MEYAVGLTGVLLGNRLLDGMSRGYNVSYSINDAIVSDALRDIAAVRAAATHAGGVAAKNGAKQKASDADANVAATVETALSSLVHAPDASAQCALGFRRTSLRELFADSAERHADNGGKNKSGSSDSGAGPPPRKTKKQNDPLANRKNAAEGDSAPKRKNAKRGGAPPKQFVVPTIHWNNVLLDPDEYYCLPVEFINSLNDTRTCNNPHTGILVVSYDNGTLDVSCRCKYPDVWGGPHCDKQVCCVNYVTGPDGNTEVQYNRLWDAVKDREVSAYDGSFDVRERMPDGSARLRCKCPNTGSMRLTNALHPLHCLPDPCFPTLVAQPPDSAEGLDSQSMRCRCGPDMISVGGGTSCVHVDAARIFVTPDAMVSAVGGPGSATESAFRALCASKHGSRRNLVPYFAFDGTAAPSLAGIEYYANEIVDKYKWYECVNPCDDCDSIKRGIKYVAGLGVGSTMVDKRALMYAVHDMASESICTDSPGRYGVCTVNERYAPETTRDPSQMIKCNTTPDSTINYNSGDGYPKRFSSGYEYAWGDVWDSVVNPLSAKRCKQDDSLNELDFPSRYLVHREAWGCPT